MKKEYKKPVIVMEDFSLSTSIATECDYETGNPSYNECGVNISGLMVFLCRITRKSPIFTQKTLVNPEAIGYNDYVKKVLCKYAYT